MGAVFAPQRVNGAAAFAPQYFTGIQAGPMVTSVAINPGTATVSGGAKRSFVATVQGQNNPSQAVTWSTDGGSIDASGTLTAPGATPSDQTVTIKATSQADPTKFSTATVTVAAAPPAAPLGRVATARRSRTRTHSR